MNFSVDKSTYFDQVTSGALCKIGIDGFLLYATIAGLATPRGRTISSERLSALINMESYQLDALFTILLRAKLIDWEGAFSKKTHVLLEKDQNLLTSGANGKIELVRND